MAAIDTVAIHAKPGVPFALPIVRGPATGYQWTLSLPPGVAQAPDTPGAPLAPDQRLGGASGSALSVIAEPGVHRIIATLARPWDPDNPARTVEIIVTVP